MLAQSEDRNAFLSGLVALEFSLLRKHLVPFELRAGQSLHHAGDRVEDVVFPHSGLVGMTIPLRQEAGAGVILVGCNGIIGGFAAAASAPATSNAEVYIAGQAMRMSASAFRHVLDQSPAIRRHAARFDAAMMAQAQQTALCNAAHQVEARICRWLLVIQDRCGGNKIPLTQATLAQMLGVRRTTVTLAHSHLEAAGVLACRRGHVQIVSREELERRSCECYFHVRSYTERLFAASSEEAPAAS
jgi:CRP-like cAMP-binding protein